MTRIGSKEEVYQKIYEELNKKYYYPKYPMSMGFSKTNGMQFSVKKTV